MTETSGQHDSKVARARKIIESNGPWDKIEVIASQSYGRPCSVIRAERYAGTLASSHLFVQVIGNKFVGGSRMMFGAADRKIKTWRDLEVYGHS